MSPKDYQSVKKLYNQLYIINSFFYVFHSKVKEMKITKVLILFLFVDTKQLDNRPCTRASAKLAIIRRNICNVGTCLKCFKML